MGLHHWWAHSWTDHLLSSLVNNHIEGLATAVVSIFLCFIISDFPEEVKWLTEEEKAYIKQRLLDDVGDSGHHAKPGIRDVLGVFKDREYHHTWPPTKILT